MEVFIKVIAIRCVYAAGCLLVFFGMYAPAQAVEQGHPAPGFELASTDKSVKLADYAGKVVYLDFWASWCGPCKQSFPWMNTMQNQYEKHGFEIVAVGVDAKQEDAMRFLAASPVRFTVAFDRQGKTPAMYGVKGMPTSVLIGRDGRVLSVHTGFDAKSRTELERAIALALGVQP
jgi:thiol-disulfide isomerase/thioredoxin